MTTSRRQAPASGEELLSRLYQQVTEREAARFAAGYDMAAGLHRYQAWLDEHTVQEQAAVAALQASLAEYTADIAVGMGGPVTLRQAVAGRPIDVTETLVADVALRSVSVDLEADRAVAELYTTHYRSLVRLAVLLVRDAGTAEEVVQDSFVAMHGAWHRLRDSEKALSYLRQSVVNRSRAVLRHRVVVDRNAPKPAPDEPSAEHGPFALLDRSAVLEALRTLPPRQREALVLRFYADMSEAQIADTMSISRGAVKSHTAHAMQALRAVLEREA